jgi:hypothetical protein
MRDRSLSKPLPSKRRLVYRYLNPTQVFPLNVQIELMSGYRTLCHLSPSIPLSSLTCANAEYWYLEMNVADGNPDADIQNGVAILQELSHIPVAVQGKVVFHSVSLRHILFVRLGT